MANQVKYIFVSLLSLFVSSVQAIPSASLTSDGVTWTLNIDSMTNNVASFSLFADVGNSTLGNAYLHEFGLSSFGSGASLSNLNVPAGSWAWKNDIIAGQGCQDNGTYDALCVYNTGSFMSAPSTGADFMFSFNVNLGVNDLFSDMIHFKVRWVAKNKQKPGEYKKVGNLISESFDFNPGPDPEPPIKIPEPGILGLLATGMLAMFAVSRKA